MLIGYWLSMHLSALQNINGAGVIKSSVGLALSAFQTTHRHAMYDELCTVSVNRFTGVTVQLCRNSRAGQLHPASWIWTCQRKAPFSLCCVALFN